MEAGAHYKYGIFRCYRVQLLCRGEALLIGKIIVVPAFAREPQAKRGVVILLKGAPHTRKHFLERCAAV